MGFASVGATAVLLTAALFTTGTGADTMLEANASLDRISMTADQRVADIGAMAVSLVDLRSNPARTTLELLNEGAATMDASQATMIVDGTPVPIDSYTIEGRTSSVWAPGLTAEFVYDDGRYDRVGLVLPGKHLGTWVV